MQNSFIFCKGSYSSHSGQTQCKTKGNTGSYIRDKVYAGPLSWDNHRHAVGLKYSHTAARRPRSVHAGGRKEQPRRSFCTSRRSRAAGQGREVERPAQGRAAAGTSTARTAAGSWQPVGSQFQPQPDQQGSTQKGSRGSQRLAATTPALSRGWAANQAAVWRSVRCSYYGSKTGIEYSFQNLSYRAGNLPARKGAMRVAFFAALAKVTQGVSYCRVRRPSPASIQAGLLFDQGAQAAHTVGWVFSNTAASQRRFSLHRARSAMRSISLGLAARCG